MTARRYPMDCRVMDRVAFIGAGETDCWIWTGWRLQPPYDYGMIWDANQKRKRLAHDWLWERFNGPVPEGMELDHLCRVPSCCRPDHVEPVTRQVNVQRGAAAEVNAARQRAKARCVNEHSLADAVIDHRGTRVCRTCRRLADARRRAGKAGLPNGEKTECKHGHPFTPENTYLTKEGWRRCRACLNESVARWRTQQRGA